MLLKLVGEALELSRAMSKDKPVDKGAIIRAITHDSYAVIALTRVREAARRWHVIGVNRALRIGTTALYGIEIGKDVTLGKGVFFAHPLGIVIGGNAKVGDRVTFMGSNTVGTAKENGYPVIEDDVIVGCGARILGPVRIGARSVIGANAVVLEDVPPDHVATGIPAVMRPIGRHAKNVNGDQSREPVS
jgi:serine O-acetyltransferase